MNHKPVLSPAGAMVAINIYALLYMLVYRLSGDRSLLELWSLVNPILSGLLAAGAAWAAFRRSPAGERATWLLLAIGFGLWVMGEGVWAWLTLSGREMP